MLSVPDLPETAKLLMAILGGNVTWYDGHQHGSCNVGRNMDHVMLLHGRIRCSHHR